MASKQVATPSTLNPRVGLFVTCLVDTLRPSVGFAALQMLQEAGCRVEVPQAQTCRGQPAFNSGDTKDAATRARRFVETFEPFDYVVAPSGSCVGMTRLHYEEALADDPPWAERARRLGERSFEITSFLVDVMSYAPRGRSLNATATYHDSCAGLRELGVFTQPRTLLGQVAGLEMRKLEGNDVCCGFGGTFCVKYRSVTRAIDFLLRAKRDHAAARAFLERAIKDHHRQERRQHAGHR